MDKYAPYKIIEYGGGGEIVEKKSRFIARVQATESEEEVACLLRPKRSVTGMPDITAMLIFWESRDRR